MANNLFISYDLMDPGQHYKQVTDAIKELGPWAKIHFSLFYVKTDLTAEQAVAHVRAAADANDKIIAIDCTNNTGNSLNLPDRVVQMIGSYWAL